ncbi:MAG: bifunctional nuclease family protein [Planctomycetaceae bacterium]|nr:bifunctional nuclease family protein [Planctomycetaceae bacterium]MCA9078952.1 bifunctional nuclease family protein [Planctomycetaceae bacterium]
MRADSDRCHAAWKGSWLGGVDAVLVRMELARIIISEINDQQIVFLREVEGDKNRSFPILIGIFEATSIDRRVQGHVPQRPLTHDLLKNVIEELGGQVRDIVITNLVDHTYYAVIRIEKDGEIIEIDSRPSDAIALATHYDPHLPIYVDEDVLDEAIT